MIAPSLVTEQDCSAKMRRLVDRCAAITSDKISSATGRNIQLGARGVFVSGTWPVPNQLCLRKEEGVAACLSVSGDIEGYIMLYLSRSGASELLGMFRKSKRAALPAFGTFERSALGEVAKLAGIALTEALSEYGGFKLHLSPPAVFIEPNCDYIGFPFFEQTTNPFQQLLVVETTFSKEKKEIDSLLVVAPEMPSLDTIMEVLEKRWESS